MNTRLRRPAVALIATALTASVLGIVPAAHAADGTISGVVTSPGGAGIFDVEVDIFQYDPVDEYWAYVDYAYTDADGVYSITALPGDYRVGFSDWSGEFIEEYYNDKNNVDIADTITVPDSGVVVVDAELAPAAHVTGHVTGPGAANLGDIRVVAYEAVDQGDYVDYSWAGYSYTAPDGSYDIGGLGGGTYRIEFNDGYSYRDASTYATEYYNDQPSLYSADDVTVAAEGLTSGIDAELALDSEVSGVVTDSSGTPVEDAWVDALVKVGNKWEYSGYTFTGPDGTYVLDGLGAGTYRVELGARIGEDYVYEYWNDHGRLSNADDIVLGVDDSVSGINAQLIAGEHDDETDPAVTNTALPTISGAAVVGQTLTATTGSWSPTPTEYYYDWLRDGQFVEGQYGSTYVLTAADLGKKITVLVTAGAEGFEYAHAESAATAPVAAAPVVAPPVVTPPVVTPPTVDVPAGIAAILKGLDVSGKPKVGKTLKISGLDKLFRTTVSYKFQWFAGAKKIKKATKSKLKITRAMKGKKISVKVTAKAATTTKSVKLKVGKVR